QFGICLQAIQQNRRFVRLIAVKKWRLPAYRHSKRPDVILLHGVAEFEIFRAVNVQELGAHPGHEELPDFFFSRHLAQGFLRPLLAVTVEVDGARILEFVFSECDRGKQDEQYSSNSHHEQTIAEVGRSSMADKSPRSARKQRRYAANLHVA